MKKIFSLIAAASLVVLAFPFSIQASGDVWVSVPTCSDANYTGTVSWNDPQPNVAGFAVNAQSPEKSGWYEWGRGVDRGTVVTGNPPYSVPIPGQFHWTDNSALVLKPGLTYTIKVSYTLAGDIGTATFNVPHCPTPTPSKNPASTSSPQTTPTPTPKPMAICADNATVESTGTPATVNLEAQKTYDFPITATNTGNTKWYDGSYYKLINTASQNTLGPAYGHLPNVVNPKGQANWNFKIFAPKESGTYPISLQMVHLSKGQYIKPNGVKCSAPTKDTPFGNILALSLVVTAPSPSPSESFTPTPIETPMPSSNGFLDWVSNNWLVLTISFLALIVLGVLAWFLKRQSSGPPVPPIPPSPSSPSVNPS